MFMPPFSIIINNQPIQLGAPLPSEIFHLAVVIQMPIQLPSEQTAHVKAWLNTVMDNLVCDYVTFNGTLIPVTELTKF